MEGCGFEKMLGGEDGREEMAYILDCRFLLCVFVHQTGKIEFNLYQTTDTLFQTTCLSTLRCCSYMLYVMMRHSASACLS